MVGGVKEAAALLEALTAPDVGVAGCYCCPCARGGPPESGELQEQHVRFLIRQVLFRLEKQGLPLRLVRTIAIMESCPADVVKLQNSVFINRACSMFLLPKGN